jgi:hypothetical protein
VTVLSVRNRVWRRDVVEPCEQRLGARISSGNVDAILARVADALTEPHDDLLARVRAAKSLNLDETGWRRRGPQRALRGAFTGATRSCRSHAAATRTRRRDERWIGVGQSTPAVLRVTILEGRRGFERCSTPYLLLVGGPGFIEASAAVAQ